MTTYIVKVHKGGNDNKKMDFIHKSENIEGLNAVKCKNDY